MLVRITEAAAKLMGTTASLKAGSWLSLRDLLFGCMLPSGNDAAYTLAEVLGYFSVAQQKHDSADHFTSVEHISLRS
jgi:serine-type D-Ala-D-Ala carboxypeptidase (penicillin-binding protein 5/6)